MKSRCFCGVAFFVCVMFAAANSGETGTDWCEVAELSVGTHNTSGQTQYVCFRLEGATNDKFAFPIDGSPVSDYMYSTVMAYWNTQTHWDNNRQSVAQVYVVYESDATRIMGEFLPVKRIEIRNYYGRN